MFITFRALFSLFEVVILLKSNICFLRNHLVKDLEAPTSDSDTNFIHPRKVDDPLCCEVAHNWQRPMFLVGELVHGSRESGSITYNSKAEFIDGLKVRV